MEVLDVGVFGEFVEECVLELEGVSHGELGDTLALLPFVQVPKTCIN